MALNVTERTIFDQFPFWRNVLGFEATLTPGRTQIVVGCGTSYHLAQSIAAALNESGTGALAVPGGEWSRRHRSYCPASEGLEVIALSRSGESTETVQAAQISRQVGVPVTALTCADGSLSRNADSVLFAPTHPEEGIVMTASASLMLQMGLIQARVPMHGGTVEAAEELLALADKHLATIIEGRSHFVCLGGGALYGVAQEATIKLQEMSLSWTQAYHPMEYRHGPISLIDQRSFVAMLYHPDTADEEARIASELRAKGAFVLGLGGPGDLSLPVSVPASVRPLVYLPTLQLLGERVAQMKGLDSTAPRHLQKVVVLS
ncbi:glucosamine--fructose-6-phosphate aminotransferase (isomerizing) [Arboricoccus pini]|uniref:Glucosamine--fructose-6-phosphate aminotransferase (Isomerizing) n=2 Tax=Arboricoccus pini TaxID=1963835 RepID=A0A212RN05_9PROT|nr:glucosamine--fructose-6-phosphate aminotransferase (isomerizing) [Arboricoccus pini]